MNIIIIIASGKINETLRTTKTSLRIGDEPFGAGHHRRRLRGDTFTADIDSQYLMWRRRAKKNKPGGARESATDSR